LIGTLVVPSFLDWYPSWYLIGWYPSFLDWYPSWYLIDGTLVFLTGTLVGI